MLTFNSKRRKKLNKPTFIYYIQPKLCTKYKLCLSLPSAVNDITRVSTTKDNHLLLLLALDFYEASYRNSQSILFKEQM